MERHADSQTTKHPIGLIVKSKHSATQSIPTGEVKRIKLVRCEEGKENAGDTSARHAGGSESHRCRPINILPRPEGLKENPSVRLTLLTLGRPLAGDDKLVDILLKPEGEKENSGDRLTDGLAKTVGQDNIYKDKLIITMVEDAEGNNRLTENPTGHAKRDSSHRGRVTHISLPKTDLVQGNNFKDESVTDTQDRCEGGRDTVSVNRLIITDLSARLREKNTSAIHTRKIGIRPTGLDTSSQDIHRTDGEPKESSKTCSSRNSRKTWKRTRKSSPSTCYVCQKVYKNKWSLATHLRTKHKVAAPVCARMPCLEPGCCFRAGRIARLITHLIQAHRMKFQCEKVTFREKEGEFTVDKDN